MKKIFILMLATVMLFSCVACSNNTTDPSDDTKPPVNDNTNPGQTDNTSPTTPSDLPIELQPPVESRPDVLTKQDFPANDSRKLYLEEKYGVTAYLMAEKTAGGIYTLVSLEGHPGVFHLFAKEDLVATGTPEDYITTDYVDDAWFAILYADIYAYFAQAAKDAGVAVDRIIVESKCAQWFMYDHTKPFVEGLASAPNGAKRFYLTVYGDWTQDPYALGKVLTALDELDFAGQITFRQVLQDISNVSNTDLVNDKSSVYSEFFERKQVK